MKKISVIIAKRHATSITLEEPFYEQLCLMAASLGLTVNELITQIDMQRTNENLSSAVRLFILQHLLDKLKTSKTNASE
jgi:predicted DNA-binding ribbon-helix-helix protein